MYEFGAVGDGVHDDAPAIQAAIDAMPTGGILGLTDADYRLNSTVTVRDKTVRIVGDGAYQIVPGGTYERRGTRLTWGGAENGVMLHAIGAPGATFEGLDLHSAIAGVTGILLQVGPVSQMGSRITHCTFRHLERCIQIGSEPNISVEQNVIEHCRFGDSYRVGIYIATWENYNTLIVQPHFGGNATNTDYHIYAEYGHFVGEHGYYGPARLGAIRLCEGHATINSPYSETHGVPFLIWDRTHPDGASTVLINPLLAQATPATQYNLISHAAASLSVFGGQMSAQQQLTNPLGRILLFGVTGQGVDGETGRGERYGPQGQIGMTGAGYARIVGSTPRLELQTTDAQTCVSVENSGGVVEIYRPGYARGLRYDAMNRVLDLATSNIGLYVRGDDDKRYRLGVKADGTLYAVQVT